MTDVYRNCFCCGRPLENSFFSDDELKQRFEDPPLGAIVFHAYGNYGTALYDPITSSNYLEISICDSCVKERMGLGRILFVKPRKETTYEVKEWEGENI